MRTRLVRNTSHHHEVSDAPATSLINTAPVSLYDYLHNGSVIMLSSISMYLT
ncbi:hypothetical protein [Vulcanisaeta sp. JCM 16161]|uniref:hypothetical protein n=1 Tax=Vulcanisaeta sp. JCM 16161 TaxID=1295372 RepID=UPI00406C9E2C